MRQRFAKKNEFLKKSFTFGPTRVYIVHVTNIDFVDE